MLKNKIKLQEVLNTIFSWHEVTTKQNVIFGSGQIENSPYHIIGTIEDTAFGVDESLIIADHILSIINGEETLPILLLVDVVGQKLEMRDEWLGMFEYFAHLLKCLHLARLRKHKIISLVYNQAIGGSFIAFGLLADRIYALSHAKVAVMWLEAISNVTKINKDYLEKISETSPVFAPGVENFKKLGGLHEVLSLSQVAQQLQKDILLADLSIDNKAQLGYESAGRTKAYEIINAIEHYEFSKTSNLLSKE